MGGPCYHEIKAAPGTVRLSRHALRGLNSQQVRSAGINVGTHIGWKAHASRMMVTPEQLDRLLAIPRPKRMPPVAKPKMMIPSPTYRPLRCR